MNGNCTMYARALAAVFLMLALSNSLLYLGIGSSSLVEIDMTKLNNDLLKLNESNLFPNYYQMTYTNVLNSDIAQRDNAHHYKTWKYPVHEFSINGIISHGPRIGSNVSSSQIIWADKPLENVGTLPWFTYCVIVAQCVFTICVLPGLAWGLHIYQVRMIPPAMILCCISALPVFLAYVQFSSFTSRVNQQIAPQLGITARLPDTWLYTVGIVLPVLNLVLVVMLAFIGFKTHGSENTELAAALHSKPARRAAHQHR